MKNILYLLLFTSLYACNTSKETNELNLEFSADNIHFYRAAMFAAIDSTNTSIISDQKFKTSKTNRRSVITFRVPSQDLNTFLTLASKDTPDFKKQVTNHKSSNIEKNSDTCTVTLTAHYIK